MIKKIQNKGITLVALVITIVILLILSGITIAQLTGSGLFGKAQLAAKETKYANAAEKVALAVNASYDENGKINDNLLKDNVNKIDGLDKKVEEVKYDLEIVVDGFKFTISEYGKITGEKTEVATLPENTPQTDAGTEVKMPSNWYSATPAYVSTEDGKVVKESSKYASTTVKAISDGTGETVPVPNGFYYVGGTVSSGVVISDDSRDQNKYAGRADVPDGAVYKDNGIAKQIIYNPDGTVKINEFTEEEEKTAIVGNQFVWIPCTATEYKKIITFKDVNGNNAWNTGWDTTTNTVEKAQIEKYGGFYIGRYEAGASNISFANNYTLEAPTGTSNWENGNFTSSKVTSGKITCKAGEIPYFHSDYPTTLEMSEKMYKDDSIRKESVISELITGTMWDMAMKFISDQSDYSDLRSTPWGNYNSDTSIVSGSNITYTEGKGRYIAVSGGSESGSFTKSDYKYHYGIRTTGWSEGAKKKNIYDLAGNLWERTQESAYYNGAEAEMFRGGSFNDACASYSACHRFSNYASITSTQIRLSSRNLH